MQKYKKVWVLYMAGFSLALAIVFLCFSDSAVLSGQQVDKPFFQIAFLAVILAPIIEELMFRGYFGSQKYLKWVSIILLPIFVILISTNFAVLVILVSLYLLLLFNFKFKKLFLENLIIVFSASLFSILHFQTEDFNQLFSLYPIMFLFALGLLVIWITINFGLVKAIIFHFLWNLAIMSAVFFALQNPDIKAHKFENETIVIQWERSPLVNTNSKGISYSKEKLIANGITLNNLLSFVNQVELNKDLNNEYYQTEVFMKYNFKIYLKDSTKTLSKPITEYFKNQKLLEYKYQMIEF
ncbi:MULTISPECIES: CPBP family intramembrane glutamic endopeptidase [Bizionia]|uniref:CPBP family intramembrane metalloprotease n=1 Tax=Bizionia algoritergicola TaxID=291187 RepID=A0A5D0R2N7_9FLAO|nr:MULTISPECIES: CPBP family intramembrane glutamic endopeptidase [Bizionia]OBX21335.1 hypothetical protein BAA08_13085 [Bizionia sp. APA-3]TYB74814.1 CPBP family intramembrane metalloprotease [Bizionia algoritergicola]